MSSEKNRAAYQRKRRARLKAEKEAAAVLALRQAVHDQELAPPELFIITHTNGERCYWRGGITDTGVAESLAEAQSVASQTACGPHTIVRYRRDLR